MHAEHKKVSPSEIDTGRISHVTPALQSEYIFYSIGVSNRTVLNQFVFVRWPSLRKHISAL